MKIFLFQQLIKALVVEVGIMKMSDSIVPPGKDHSALDVQDHISLDFQCHLDI